MDAHIAEAAGRLLKENPAFRMACERLEEKYMTQWRASEPHQTHLREAAYQRIQVLIDFLRVLRSFYEEGDAEKKAAERKERLSKLDL